MSFLPTFVASLAPLAPEPYACDVRFLDAKTVVVLETSRRIDVSTDAGATWSARELPWDPVDGSMDVAMDERGLLWSFLSDRSNREVRRAELAYSRDLGATWTTLHWPTSTSFPHSFLTHGRQPLVMLDDHGQCWMHRPAEQETLRAWTKLGAVVPGAVDTPSSRLHGFSNGLGLFVTSRGVYRSDDRGLTWRNLDGPVGLLAIEPFPDTQLGLVRLVGLTPIGDVRFFDFASRTWSRLGSLPRADARDDLRPYAMAAAKEGVWITGRNRSGALAGRLDLDGRWRSPAETPSNADAAKIRIAPDDRAWLVHGTIDACGPAAEVWTHVWPR